jgi:hypothetical protein
MGDGAKFAENLRPSIFNKGLSNETMLKPNQSRWTSTFKGAENL